MCGIVSIFSYNNGNSPVDREELRRVRDYMISRGPDGYGEWYSSDNLVGLGHRRLSIIDLSESGAQPMKNKDGSLVITFNGEIYNYKTLRTNLEKKGYHFHSTSDTEVLLNLYAEKGVNMLHDLRGMFAFAIWDSKKKGLFLARDPFGIKPLYYSDDGKVFLAASQVKALLRSKIIDTSPEPAGHVGFFIWGNVPEPYTLYKGIRSLPAGSYMWVDQNGNKTVNTYCNITGIFVEADKSTVQFDRKEMLVHLRNVLLDTIQHHLIADVPVGIFLSSGMDSTTLVALASEINRSPLDTVTLGFKEYVGTINDETSLATLIADSYNTLHHTIWVSKENFDNKLSHLFASMDQPTIDGVNSYFISKAAVRAGLKVSLSGLGGDELFGSYPSFKQIPRISALLGFAKNESFPGKTFRFITQPFLKHMTSPKYAGLLEYGGTYSGAYLLRRGLFMPWELPEILDGDIVRQGWKELRTLVRLDETINNIDNGYLRVSALETSWYMRNQLLRDTDWAGMAHSLEIRVPLVDIELLRSVAPMLGKAESPQKRDMASTPSKALPDAVLNKDKTGFSVPVNQWIYNSKTSGDRGLRGWAKRVYAEYQGEDGVELIENKHVKRRKGIQSKTILIFRTGQLGDTLVAMPAIHAVRQKYPNHRLVLLTDQHPDRKYYISSWNVLEPTGWFDDVIFYNPDSALQNIIHKMYYLSPKLRHLAPEYVFNLAPERSAWQNSRDRFFFQHIIGVKNYKHYGAYIKPKKKSNGTLPYIDPEWKRLLQITEQESQDNKFSLKIPDNEREKAGKIIEEMHAGQEKIFLALSPGSKRSTTKWPTERFAELGKLLIENYDKLELLVLGGKDDIETGEKLCSIWNKKGHNLAGRLSVYGSAAVIEHCVAFVGNDTGTMHLAAMVGKPCVAIFSARNYPGQWEPYGNNHLILRHETECAGCKLEVCDKYNNKCLKLITVDEVFEAAKKILQKNTEFIALNLKER
jgi:asparagine synthase (glutamine-hydrolysing)